MKNTARTSKKISRRILIPGILLIVLLAVVIFVTSIASTNVKAMNQSVDTALSELKKHYTLTPVDPGEYSDMKLFGLLKFDIEQYDIEGLGNLSIMRVNMGIMQMATFVITPQAKNMPLFSADYMYILSNRKAYLEFYDLVKEKDATYNALITSLSNVRQNYSSLEDFEVEPAWYADLLSVASYKSATKKQDTDLQNILHDSLTAYLTHADQLPLLSADEKAEKLAITVEYTDGLIERGGVSTDVFKKDLGAEKTKDFFDKVFFGTGR